MTDNFQTGDTVELKSGGPTMTIDSLGVQGMGGKTQGAYVSWFDAKMEPKKGWYPLTSLKKVAV